MLTVPWSGTNAAEILAKRPRRPRGGRSRSSTVATPAEVFAALWASEMQAMLGETDGGPR
jgi:hypothetical protein